MRSYCIYKHTLPNGKVYIGQTCHPQQRWRPSSYVNNCLFHRAILKYGWENITHEILKDNLTLEEANEAEKYYIKKYQSTNIDYGYNLRDGGESGGKFVYKTEKFKERYKQVYQYTLDGIFLTEWENLTFAAEALGDIKKICGISNCCSGNRKSAYGYQWSYEKQERMPPQIKCGVPQRIAQKDKDGNIINIYNSLAEAKEALGMKSHKSISNVLNGLAKTAYGFYWEKVD